MASETKPNPRSMSEGLSSLVEHGTKEQLTTFVCSLGASEIAHELDELTEEAQARLITAIDPSEAARTIESIPEVQAATIVSNIAPESAAKILDLIESDEQVDILSELSENEADAILSRMSPEESQDVRARLNYARHSAGGLMITEFLSYEDSLCASHVIDDLRRRADTYADYSVSYVFVTRGSGELCGVLRLRDLVLVPSSTAITEIMIEAPVSVGIDTDLHGLQELFDHHRYLGVPVTDGKHRIVGIVRRADVEEAVAERSESDYLKASGILGGDELRSMPLFLRSGRRLSWLSINILLNIGAASIIALYQDTLQAVIALAVFLPIISDMSGCSGAQAIAVSIRELSLGIARPSEIFRVWRKEVLLGVINGSCLGALLASVAWLWKGNPYLGIVVGVALAINTVVAVSIGGVLPLLLSKLGKDPALASGPILTTFTDMCGFFAVLSLASAFLPVLI